MTYFHVAAASNTCQKYQKDYHCQTKMIEGIFGEYEANENRPGPTLLLGDGPLSYPNTSNLVSSREYFFNLVSVSDFFC